MSLLDESRPFAAPFQSSEAAEAYRSGIANMSEPAPEPRIDEPTRLAMERIRVARDLTGLLGFRVDVDTVSMAADGLEVIGMPSDDPYDREITGVVLGFYLESRFRQAGIDGGRRDLDEALEDAFPGAFTEQDFQEFNGGEAA